MTPLPPEIESAPVVPDLYSLAVGSCRPGGLYLEFGVATGASLKLLRERIPASSMLYGFDSFDGIPEPWNGFPKGWCATTHIPSIPNTTIVQGMFADTLPLFAQEYPQYVSLMHIDCDLYSSTRTIFRAFASQIVPGTVILFDELFGYSGYEQHELRALLEFISERDITIETIGRWNAYRAAILIREVP